jgi:hypothetical protein
MTSTSSKFKNERKRKAYTLFFSKESCLARGVDWTASGYPKTVIRPLGITKRD